MSTATRQTYRRALLGIANDEEESIVEEAILAGKVDASFLNDVEDELIDDYVVGSVTPEERDAVQTHFLEADGRKQKLALASALVEYARKQSQGKHAAERERTSKAGFVSMLFYKRVALLATVASILLTFLVGYKQIKLRQQVQVAGDTKNQLVRLQDELRNKSVGLDHADLSFSAPVKVPYPEANRMPTIEFGASTRSILPPLLRIPAQARFVQLESTAPLPSDAKYRQSILSSNGERLWVQEFRGSVLPAAQRGTIVFPAAILAPSLYHFQIEKAMANGQFELLEDYVFRVERE